MAADRIAESLPEGLTEDQLTREKKLRVNEDKLFCGTNDGIDYLAFFSKLFSDWLDEIRQKYGEELQQTKEGGVITLKGEEGIITFYPFVKILVRGKKLMETFKTDSPQMKTEVLSAEEADGVNAPPIVYPGGYSQEQKKRFKDDFLHQNKDTLFVDLKTDGSESNFIFSSSLVREWLYEIKKQYPSLTETRQDDMIKLKSTDGSFIVYPSVTVVVKGELMERFENDFLQMKQSAQIAAKMAELSVVSRKART